MTDSQTATKTSTWSNMSPEEARAAEQARASDDGRSNNGHAADDDPDRREQPLDADVGIIGAGFAGLAAALMLRRHRRSVILLDGGPSRNAWAHEVHGYLGAHGLSGKEMRDLGRAQVQEVGAQFVQTKVSRATRQDGAFTLSDDDGRSWRVSRLLIATGVTDVYPDIDNFLDFFGRTVYVCPHCDAYEVRDQPIAIVAWNEATPTFARKLLQWTRYITVVTDGRDPAISEEDCRRLAELGIQIMTQTVRRFEGTDGQLSGLRFEDGSQLPVAAAFFNIAHHFQNDVAKQLGCKLNPAGCIAVDDHLQTTVEHVWAAGDVAGEEQLVAVAAAHGVKAAIDIYRSLPLPTGEPTPG